MSFTMVRKQLFIIHLLCVITLSTTAKSIGFVKEFNIADTKEITKEHHATTKTANEQLKTENKNEPQGPNSKDQPENNSNLQEEDSVYTQSDLEEANDATDVANHQIDNKEAKNDRQPLTEDKSLLDIYTESDLDETKSRDEVKRVVDKKSTSYLFVPRRKRNKRSATTHDEENGDGSGEGSGDLPTSL